MVRFNKSIYKAEWQPLCTNARLNIIEQVIQFKETIFVALAPY